MPIFRDCLTELIGIARQGIWSILPCELHTYSHMSNSSNPDIRRPLRAQHPFWNLAPRSHQNIDMKPTPFSQLPRPQRTPHDRVPSEAGTIPMGVIPIGIIPLGTLPTIPAKLWNHFKKGLTCQPSSCAALSRQALALWSSRSQSLGRHATASGEATRSRW